MDKVIIAKRIVSNVVAFGTAKIVYGIVRKNSIPTRSIDQIAIMVAGYVIGSMLADVTVKYTDAKIDEIVKWLKEKNLIQLNTEEPQDS